MRRIEKFTPRPSCGNSISGTSAMRERCAQCLMSTQLEIAVIKKFVTKDKQARYIQFVSSDKTRKKFLNVLSHFRDFNWNLLEELSSEHDILDKLQRLNFKVNDCYVISEDSEIDQKIISIEKVLNKIGGYRDYATILVFGNADMIYFEGEPPHNRYISKLK
jgi:hypothetical protein